MTTSIARTWKDSGVIGRLEKTGEPSERAKLRAVTPRQVFDILHFAGQTGHTLFVTFCNTIRKVLRGVPTDMRLGGPAHQLWNRAVRLHGNRHGKAMPPSLTGDCRMLIVACLADHRVLEASQGSSPREHWGRFGPRLPRAKAVPPKDYVADLLAAMKSYTELMQECEQPGTCAPAAAPVAEPAAAPVAEPAAAPVAEPAPAPAVDLAPGPSGPSRDPTKRPSKRPLQYDPLRDGASDQIRLGVAKPKKFKTRSQKH